MGLVLMSLPARPQPLHVRRAQARCQPMCQCVSICPHVCVSCVCVSLCLCMMSHVLALAAQQDGTH